MANIVRWICWILPVLILIAARLRALQSTKVSPAIELAKSMNVTTNPSSVYILVSKPQNSLTIAAVQLLHPATVFVAYPPSEGHKLKDSQRQLKAALSEEAYESKVRWCPFDPFGTKDSVHDNVILCLNMIQKEFSAVFEAGPLLDGILFNSYGAVGDGTPNTETGLLPLAEYKLIGNLIFLHDLMNHRPSILKRDARVIFVGSESARGLPKMGFPVPHLGETIPSIQSFLTGSAYRKSAHNSEIATYQWETAYANLCAIVVLYVKRLARDHPEIFLGVVSPGMTKESFNPSNSPKASWIWKLQLFFFQHVVFGLLQKWEIAKTSEEGALLLVQALVGWSTDVSIELAWNYTTGSFVGAKGGTGGPICDQTLLDGGKMFLDRELQDLTYDAVQEYLR